MTALLRLSCASAVPSGNVAGFRGRTQRGLAWRVHALGSLFGVVDRLTGGRARRSSRNAGPSLARPLLRQEPMSLRPFRGRGYHRAALFDGRALALLLT